MIQQTITKNWKFRQFGQEKWQDAVVPGTVYTDLLRNGCMEDPFWKDNENKAWELMDYDYEYEGQFTIDEPIKASEKVLLHFDGIDTIADIYWNHIWIGNTENMHRIWEFVIREKILYLRLN